MKFNKSLIKIIIVMAIISIAGLAYAWVYYGNINDSEDPRTLSAKLYYQKYDKYISMEKYNEAIPLLDSIISIYQQYADYNKSYEMGVVQNNKAAVYLTQALALNGEDNTEGLLQMAEYELNSSIIIYENWLMEFGKLSKQELKAKMAPYYYQMNISHHSAIKYINKRVDDLQIAQRETKRRLSVSYTNLGIVNRHKGEYEKALNNYRYALELWDKNLSAQNNINIILGRPLEQRGVLEKIFPDER